MDRENKNEQRKSSGPDAAMKYYFNSNQIVQLIIIIIF